MGYAFQMPEDVRRQVARVSLLLYASGALTTALLQVTPDSDTSDHLGLAIMAGVFALMALVFWLWRTPPAWALFGGCLMGLLAISALVGITRPMLLTPIFYIWPMMLAAHYFPRRQVWIASLVMASSFGAALLFWAEPVQRLAVFAVTLSMVAVVVVVLRSLREQNTALVARLTELAVRDPLTGVLNRAAFEDRLRSEVARSARQGRPYALAVLDLDHFKQVNDRFGHAAGDRALKRVCALVGETIRATDVFARVGGEEFALLMCDTDPSGAERAAEKLRMGIEREARAETMPLTISIGLAVGHGTDADEVLLAADRALYEAKRRGRNRVVRAPDLGLLPAAPALSVSLNP